MEAKFSINVKFKRVFVNILGIFVILAIAFPAVGSVHAQESILAPALTDASLLVTTAEDELNEDGDCSLREAIQAANTDTAVDACPAGSDLDVINFSDNYTITLSDQLPVITTSISIIGNGAGNTIVQANANPEVATYRVFYITSTGDLTLGDLTVRHGNCSVLCSPEATNGGGVYNDGGTLTISNSTFADNNASVGAAIFNHGVSMISNSTFVGNSASYAGVIINDATMTITKSIFSNNSAWTTGGGISNWTGTLAVSDSTFFANSQLGIYNYMGTATISGSTFSNNSSNSYGGGIYNNAGTMSVTNSTFSENTSSSYGGGIDNDGTLVVSNSTFSGNGALFGGGISNLGVLHLKNSILAGSTSGGDCLNYYGTFATNINNLIEDNTCDPTISGEANLGPLADNGGPTQTFALLPGSPAIDAGSPDGCTDHDGNVLGVDQRGEPRPADGNGDGNAVCDIGAFEAGEVSPSAPWRDDFDGPLGEPWYWVNENPDKWNLTENPGFLRIYASPYEDSGQNGNRLLRPVAEGDFVIKTRVTFEPNTNFQFAGLTIYQDEENQLSLGRAFCDTPDVCASDDIYFDKILGGNFTDGNFGTSIGNPSAVSLRLERRGDMVRGFYSLDEGISWYEVGIHFIPSDFVVNGVGLIAVGDFDKSDEDIPADFDFFELTEGWGFLPEGFHDYEQGDVPNWACNAGGWAADPDDRAADVNVDIVVDDQTVASLVAGEFRQDLADAGVCGDGNCSFSTSLWDVISSYEPHKVDVWAQDDTGDWVLLSNSAKTLTCRTYDIYTFDPVTSTTKQITDLRDKQEYNPRWSPDGKKIVHDAWSLDWSSHGVYITDVQTGVSTPLAGAEGGSYPTWAPNSKWIAFDRGADNDNRLFIVPPTGGDPKLVRDDAFMASWSPNSQRLAFHQPSDGSIRTMNLNGQNVTLVAERGNGPAWSPDGEWIAYEVDGDIWKVHVNNNGNPLDGPVQLTSSPAWEGRPTWSYDSKTIAFHAGMGQDTDIWTIPAAGGTPTWLTGAPNFGDYDANYSLKGRSQYISYSSFSPDGQAARPWGSAFSYDVGTWSVGEHSYTLGLAGDENLPIVSFNVVENAPSYDGYVLLRPWALRTRLGEECPAIDPPLIRPDQNTRFHYGWMTNTMTYQEAIAEINSLAVTANWDDGMSAELQHHEIFSWSSVDWAQYSCSATQATPQIWQQVNTNGFGDPQTNGIASLEVFHDQLYAGASNWNSGGQVWRQEEDGQWQQVSEAGFGKGSVNPAITDLAVFHDQLYAGVGWDGSTGEVWRTADGTNWESITTDSFGDATSTIVSSFAVFGDMLYAGTGSGQIWRSETGDSGSWIQVAPDGPAFYGNVTGFAEYGGALYAAIESSSNTPLQVWRSDNGSDWITVTADGFGDPGNFSSGGFAVFDGSLYLGTRNDNTGGQIWRTADGTSWEQVVGNGFSDVNNVKVESLFVYGDKLYAGTNNLQAGIQILRSADGVNWMHVNVNGFGDSNNFATLWSNATVEYQGKLFVGTWNGAEGGELWIYTPSWAAISKDRWGEAILPT